MILLCGIPSEGPLKMVRRELEVIGAPYVLFDQRRFASCDAELSIESGQPLGWLRVSERTIDFGDVVAVYIRMMEEDLLPELRGESPDSTRRAFCRGLHEILYRWVEVMPGRAVNRIAAMASNSSKPYQAQLIQEEGFLVPETVVTNDPLEVLDFVERHGRVIYKSLSGVRSIVRELEVADLDRLDAVRRCPVQFQELVTGIDVRVHTVGQLVFATAVSSDATDYRYAHSRWGTDVDLEAIELSDDLAEACLRLARRFGLAFAGIDLRMDLEGRAYCFEVNPSPAFSYYEANTGQPIARALARYLAEGD
jgi:hypothetical protein